MVLRSSKKDIFQQTILCIRINFQIEGEKFKVIRFPSGESDDLDFFYILIEFCLNYHLFEIIHVCCIIRLKEYFG